jgi:hypothetical protein
MHICIWIQLLALERCFIISTGSCLTTLLTALISLRATNTHLPIWKTGWDHSTSEIMRSWWMCQIMAELTGIQTLPDTKSASILTVTPLRSSLNMYDNNIYFLIACFVNSSPEWAFWIVLIVWLVTLNLQFCIRISGAFCILLNAIRKYPIN